MRHIKTCTFFFVVEIFHHRSDFPPWDLHQGSDDISGGPVETGEILRPWKNLEILQSCDVSPVQPEKVCDFLGRFESVGPWRDRLETNSGHVIGDMAGALRFHSRWETLWPSKNLSKGAMFPRFQPEKVCDFFGRFESVGPWRDRLETNSGHVIGDMAGALRFHSRWETLWPWKNLFKAAMFPRFQPEKVCDFLGWFESVGPWRDRLETNSGHVIGDMAGALRFHTRWETLWPWKNLSKAAMFPLFQPEKVCDLFGRFESVGPWRDRLETNSGHVIGDMAGALRFHSRWETLWPWKNLFKAAMFPGLNRRRCVMFWELWVDRPWKTNIRKRLGLRSTWNQQLACDWRHGGFFQIP